MPGASETVAAFWGYVWAGLAGAFFWYLLGLLFLPIRWFRSFF